MLFSLKLDSVGGLFSSLRHLKSYSLRLLYSLALAFSQITLFTSDSEMDKIGRTEMAVHFRRMFLHFVKNAFITETS